MIRSLRKRRYRRLLSLAAAPRWTAPLLTALGLVAGLLESFGLLMFIPLVQNLGVSAPEQGGIGALVSGLFDSVPEDIRTLLVLIVLCSCILAKNIVEVISVYVTKLTEGNVAHRLRHLVFSQTLSSCIDYRSTGTRVDIVTIIANHTWKVASGLTMLYRILINMCMLMVLVAAMIWTSAYLAAVASLLLGATLLLLHWASTLADETGRAVTTENKRFGLRIWESIKALQLIRGYGQESYEVDRFNSLSDRLRQRMLKLDMLWASPGPIAETSTAVLIGVLIMAGTTMGVSTAELMAFLAMLYRLQMPSRALLESKLAIDGLMGAIEDVETFIEETREPYITTGSKKPQRLQHSIVFDDVSFRYQPDDPWVLRHLSLTIPAGQTTAIVGASGAGKSTLMALMFRFHDPTEGRILVDGIPLLELDLKRWRAQLALMAQEVELFNASIATNLAYGEPDAPLEKLRSASRIAGADEFISRLPDNYETIVGDSGLRLSGGQRQRVALARTILRNPALLLLDEATNSLDTESERLFHNALQQYGKGRTVVIIAHRLSTVRIADKVVVVERGDVVETGSPEELLIQRGRFCELNELQQDDTLLKEQ